MVVNSVVIFAPSLALGINCCVFVFSSFGYLCFSFVFVAWVLFFVDN